MFILTNVKADYREAQEQVSTYGAHLSGSASGTSVVKPQGEFHGSLPSTLQDFLRKLFISVLHRLAYFINIYTYID